MTMVYVWIVRVAVEHPAVCVWVTMALFRREVSAMPMLMMLIVTMPVVMHDRIVPVLMLMSLRQM